MLMISGNDPIQSIDTVLVANLTAFITHPERDVTRRHLVAILRHPHDMIAVVMCSMHGVHTIA